jgi:hypothetical protein
MAFEKKLTKGAAYDGTTELPEANLEIGMDFDLWNRDRGGFHTTPEMLTGGRSAAFGAFSGVEVGDNYQDAMGEDRTEKSYVRDNAMKLSEGPGSMGPSGPAKPGAFGMERSSMTGKRTLGAPQVYRTYTKQSKE